MVGRVRWLMKKSGFDKHIPQGSLDNSYLQTKRVVMIDHKRQHVIIIGMSDAQADMLVHVLGREFTVEIITETLLAYSRPPEEQSVIISGEYQLEKDDGRAAVLAMRNYKNIWNPVIMLIQQESVNTEDAAEWALWFLRTPPDLSTLRELIRNVHPLQAERRISIMRACVLGIWQSLNQLKRAVAGHEASNQSELRSLLKDAHRFAVADSIGSQLSHVSNLIRAIERLLVLPGIPQNEIDTMRVIVVDAETANREAGGGNQLTSTLHRLNNMLRLADWSQDAVLKVAGPLKDSLCTLLSPQSSYLLPEVIAILEELREILITNLEKVTASNEDAIKSLAHAIVGITPQQAVLAAVLSTWHLIGESSPSDGINRFVVIEDDLGWLAQITGILHELAPDVTVDSATTVKAARSLLLKSGKGTLALVDLGLPIDDNKASKGLLELDAGLTLIREFAGNGARYMVLTAAENYSDAVRGALTSGVDPADYIQKDPAQWEGQLRSRIQLAIHARPISWYPRIEIFSSTARLIRIDGVEIALTRKPFAVIEYLASHGRQWTSIMAMRRALTTPDSRDITPVMSIEQLALLEQGERLSPYDLLTPKHLQDYVYDARHTITDTLRRAAHPHALDEIICYDTDYDAYRISGDILVYNDFRAFQQQTHPRKVLIVEDSTQWGGIIEQLVTAIGFTARWAKTVEEARIILDEWIPDIVTLDLELPFDAVAMSKSEFDSANGVLIYDLLAERFAEIRVIVLSSLAWKDSLMLDFLRKGITPADYIYKNWDDALDRLTNSIWRQAVQLERGSVIPPEASLTARLHYVTYDPDHPGEIQVDKSVIKLSRMSAKAFAALTTSPNAPVGRDILTDILWNPEELSDTFEDNLNTVMRRLRNEITKGSQENVDGADLIRSADGVYWIQGVIDHG